MLRHVEVPFPSDADGDVEAYGALVREFVGAVVAEPEPKPVAMARQDDHMRMFSAWCEAEGLGALVKTVLVSNGGKQEMALVPLVDAKTGTPVVAKPVCGTRIRTRGRSALVAGGRLAVARRACARGRRRSSATCSRWPAARFARRRTAVRRTTATALSTIEQRVSGVRRFYARGYFETTNPANDAKVMKDLARLTGKVVRKR